MSVFQTLLNLGKLNTYRKSLRLTLPACKCSSVRRSSDVPKKFVTFDEVAKQRRAEAKRSIVVQVNSEKSFSELYGYCSKYASISGMHHYKNSEDEHFILIECSTEESLKEVIRACGAHQRDLDVMALESPFLWFRASPEKSANLKPPEGVSLVTENADMNVNEELLYGSLMNCDTVSEQIQMLYDRSKLNDLGVRLRYIVARQVENLFESMYSNICVRPFGSTVNGFGNLGCDLDLVLTNDINEEMLSENRRLVFHQQRGAGRGVAPGGRPWARHVELLGAALELRAAGAGRVARVPLARVPIAQCTHRYADLEVDLCYNNMSGVYMSELLWLLGGADARVRPLTVAVRRWARAAGLTSPHPGRWITNFPLTLLVLFFLQQRRAAAGALLPPVASLVRHAGPEDVRIAEDNIDCTFLRTRELPRDLPDGSGELPDGSGNLPNDSDLYTLLLQFFEFYAQFDFQDQCISVVAGRAARKPGAQPLHIANPLQPALNVSKNVSYEECERLKAEVRNAAWQLESGGVRGGAGVGARGEGWGLLALVEDKSSRDLKRLLRVGNSHRLVSVKDLFKEDDPPGDGLKKLNRLTQKEVKKGDLEAAVKQMKAQLDSGKKKEPLKFKNTQVASEVFRIRRNKLL